MARSKRPTGDQATNARKRYYRAAERYLKQAENAVGAEAAKLRSLAELRLNDAVKTYSKGTTQQFSKSMQRIANQLGVDLNEKRREMQSMSAKQEAAIRGKAISEARSIEAKASAFEPETMRQREARALLNSDIGSRIIGGTVSVWQDAATVETDEGSKIDNTKIIPELYKFFKVDNLADLLDKIQDITGDILYQDMTSEHIYESAKIAIQTYVKSQQNG